MSADPRASRQETSAPESFWTADAPRWPRYPALDAEIRVDVAIVGGGFTGLACGYYLRHLAPSLRVAVVEAHRLGSGASSRNSGLFGAYYTGWRRRLAGDPAGSETFKAIGRRGHARLLAFLDEEGIDCEVQQATTLLLAAAPDVAALRDEATAWDALGVPARWLDAAALEAVGTRFYAGGIALADRYRLHPGKLVSGLVGAAARAGVLLYEDTPALGMSAARPARIACPAGAITADRVVLATNAYGSLLGDAAACLVPVHHAVVVTRPLTDQEVAAYGLAAYPARLEVGVRTHTMRLTRDRRVTMRETLGYGSGDPWRWPDLESAYAGTVAAYVARYPWVPGMALEGRWHCVTAHTDGSRPLFGPIEPGRIYASVGYNGSGVMACHYHGYLLACHLAGEAPDDYERLCTVGALRPVAGETRRRRFVEDGIGV